VSDINVVHDGSNDINDGSIVIISYDLAIKKAKDMVKRNFGIVIAVRIN
jgi:hypothetical protein